MTKQTDPQQAKIGAAASMVAIGAPFFTMGLLFDGALQWAFLPLGVVFLCIGSGALLTIVRAQSEQAAQDDPPTDVRPR